MGASGGCCGGGGGGGALGLATAVQSCEKAALMSDIDAPRKAYWEYGVLAMACNARGALCTRRRARKHAGGQGRGVGGGLQSLLCRSGKADCIERVAGRLE